MEEILNRILFTIGIIRIICLIKHSFNKEELESNYAIRQVQHKSEVDTAYCCLVSE